MNEGFNINNKLIKLQSTQMWFTSSVMTVCTIMFHQLFVSTQSSIFVFFVAANIPYCINPRLNALCILSKQYASLTHFKYFVGLNMNPRGSYMPTQMECRHDAIVGVTQSAVFTGAISFVASISSLYDSIEIK
jgi:hypothetical protein